MGQTIELPFQGAVALQGTPRGVWLADRGSRSLICLDAVRATELTRIALPEPPVALAAAKGFIAVVLESGVIAAFDLSTRAALWRRTLASSNVLLRSGSEHVWAAEPDGGALLSYDRSGAGARAAVQSLRMFTPSGNGVFWLSRDSVLASHDLAGNATGTAPFSAVGEVGSMAACGNAIWLSVANKLLLVDEHSLTVRTSLDAPEGPVPHLLCEDGILVGGLHGVFALNPMSDARVHPLDITPASPLQAIAAVPSKVWALETARPVVHIADLM